MMQANPLQKGDAGRILLKYGHRRKFSQKIPDGRFRLISRFSVILRGARGWFIIGVRVGDKRVITAFCEAAEKQVHVHVHVVHVLGARGG